MARFSVVNDMASHNGYHQDELRRNDRKRPSNGHDRDVEIPSKKPRLENGHSKHHGHQHQNGYPMQQSSHNQNGTFKQQHHAKTKSANRADPYSSHPPLKGPSQLPARRDALPDLPSIIDRYSSCVFTHPSLGAQELIDGTMVSYDRLEWLGDAYLELMASRYIFSLHSELSAGRMSQVREYLVKNETLAQFAIEYGFDSRLRIAEASRPADRKDMVKVHGDLFEAYVAAVVLSDGLEGFGNAEEWMVKLWEGIKGSVVREGGDETRAKSELQTRIGFKGVNIDYKDERPSIVHKGKGIETHFVGVYLTGWGWENQHLGSGQGMSKKAAGMAAARQALDEKKEMIQKIDKLKAIARREAELERAKQTDGEVSEVIEKTDKHKNAKKEKV